MKSTLGVLLLETARVWFAPPGCLSAAAAPPTPDNDAAPSRTMAPRSMEPTPPHGCLRLASPAGIAGRRQEPDQSLLLAVEQPIPHDILKEITLLLLEKGSTSRFEKRIATKAVLRSLGSGPKGAQHVPAGALPTRWP